MHKSCALVPPPHDAVVSARQGLTGNRGRTSTIFGVHRWSKVIFWWGSALTLPTASSPTCPHAAAIATLHLSGNMCCSRAMCTALSRHCWRSACAASCEVRWAAS